MLMLLLAKFGLSSPQTKEQESKKGQAFYPAGALVQLHSLLSNFSLM